MKKKKYCQYKKDPLEFKAVNLRSNKKLNDKLADDIKIEHKMKEPKMEITSQQEINDSDLMGIFTPITKENFKNFEDTIKIGRPKR